MPKDKVVELQSEQLTEEWEMVDVELLPDEAEGGFRLMNSEKVEPEVASEVASEVSCLPCLPEISQIPAKNGARRDLNMPLFNGFVQRMSAQDMVEKARAIAYDAQSCPSSLDAHVRGENAKGITREMRVLLGNTGSLFQTENLEGIRWCPFSAAGGDCNGRHCEPFWKPILKQEKRTTPLCSVDCKFCHDPRHFPSDEWVKLHVHRTPAARRRNAARKKKGAQ